MIEPGRFISLLFTLSTIIASAQNNWNKGSIDSLSTNTIPGLIAEGNFKNALSLNSSILQKSKELGYDRGEVLFFYNNSLIFFNKGSYYKALENIEKTEEFDFFDDSKLFQSEVLLQKGQIYNAFGYHSFAIEKYREALELLKTTDHQDFLKSKVYINLALAFEKASKPDSVVGNYKKAIDLKPSSYSFSLLSEFFSKHNQPDSAAYYLELSLKSPGDNNLRERLSLYKAEALYFESTEDFENAICAYKKTLKLGAKTEDREALLFANKKIASLYKSIGNSEKAALYFEKAGALADSLVLVQNKARDVAARDFVESYDSRSREYTFSWLLIGGLMVLLAATGLVVVYFRRKKIMAIEFQEKQRSIKEIKEEPEVVEPITKNEALDLINTDQTAFLTQFKHRHKVLYYKIMSQSPKPSRPEVNLLAMIWVGLSSKEIANCTFVQHKTIQTKKYRLRKKLSLPKGTDFQTWMDSL